jgi:hypothetical protein
MTGEEQRQVAKKPLGQRFADNIRPWILVTYTSRLYAS